MNFCLISIILLHFDKFHVERNLELWLNRQQNLWKEKHNDFVLIVDHFTGKSSIKIFAVKSVMSVFCVDFELINGVRRIVSNVLWRIVCWKIRCFETIGLIIGLKKKSFVNESKKNSTDDSRQIDVIQFFHHLKRKTFVDKQNKLKTYRERFDELKTYWKEKWSFETNERTNVDRKLKKKFEEKTKTFELTTKSMEISTADEKVCQNANENDFQARQLSSKCLMNERFVFYV